jgi:hypothetical protein
MGVDGATQASEEATFLKSQFGPNNCYPTRAKKRIRQQELDSGCRMPFSVDATDYFSWTWSGLLGHPRPLLVEPHQRRLLAPLGARVSWLDRWGTYPHFFEGRTVRVGE